MPNIFEVRDPNGIRIYCSEFQWETHIVANHGMMEHNVDAILETLQNPELILPSRDSNPPLDERRIYTKKSQIASYYPKVPYTHVIVSACGGSGEVITAYPSKSETSGSSGEEAIYVANK